MLETRRGPHDMDEGKEGETSFKSSMDESSGCTVDDATDGPEKKTKVQSHHLSRLQKLRAHHKACEERYMKAYTKTLNDEGEKTLHLYQSMKTKKVHQSSDDSDGTVTLDPTPDMDTGVPELRRTDSVILNRKMLGYAAEESLSSSELSEDEYIPETEEESDSNSSADEEGLAKNVKQHKKGKVKSKTSRSQPCKRRRVTRSSSLANSGTKESSSSDEYDNEESSSPDHSDVTVMMLKKKTDGGRLYNKKYYCLFCSKPFSKMARHLESKHKDMPEVARAVAFPKGSKEQRLQLSFLRNKGNRCHNAQVLKGGTGTVIPRQQTIAPVRASDNLHCVKEMDDLADFLGHDIRVHQQYYQLPEGTLQLAKISKSLMAMERGQLSESKGRNLDEIQIDPQERVLMDSDGSDSENEKEMTENDASDSPSNSADKSKKSTAGVGQHKNQQPPKGKNDKKLQLNDKDLEEPHTTKRSSQNSQRKWSTEEIEAVEKTLMDCIRSGKVPGKAQCMECIESSPAALQGRTWEGVKFYVKNRIDSLKQKM